VCLRGRTKHNIDFRFLLHGLLGADKEQQTKCKHQLPSATFGDDDVGLVDNSCRLLVIRGLQPLRAQNDYELRIKCMRRYTYHMKLSGAPPRPVQPTQLATEDVLRIVTLVAQETQVLIRLTRRSAACYVIREPSLRCLCGSRHTVACTCGVSARTSSSFPSCI
jgi:hypothetical protein